jgi:hypothetical protein
LKETSPRGKRYRALLIFVDRILLIPAINKIKANFDDLLIFPNSLIVFIGIYHFISSNNKKTDERVLGTYKL